MAEAGPGRGEAAVSSTRRIVELVTRVDMAAERQQKQVSSSEAAQIDLAMAAC